MCTNLQISSACAAHALSLVSQNTGFRQVIALNYTDFSVLTRNNDRITQIVWEKQ